MATQKGKIYKLIEPVEISGGDYKKAQIVLEQTMQGKNGEFSNYIPMELFGKPKDVDARWTQLLNDFSVGDFVEATLAINGRPSKKDPDGMYFPQVKLLNMQHGEQQQSDNAATQPPSNNVEEEDDLPF